MAIRLLPTKIINRIAAGEVVARPASVVKELAENSIDADADEIKITIAQGGRNLIKVKDNGIGIKKEEIKLALERHATSKLPDDDIVNITHMGFRGEALPSIASVSRMDITSRTSNDETGWTIKIEGGNITRDLTPKPCEQGSNIEVRDLFFATPNRLKFLKTEKAETQYIIDIIDKIAMANPQIAFSLTVNDKELFKYPRCNNYIERLVIIKGQEFAENTIEINAEKNEIKIIGYAGIPTYNRGNSHYLYLFVNHRPVQDTLLINAVKAAYQDFIPHRRYPIVVLFLTLASHIVDVNVHPTKAEVRFQDKNFIRHLIVNELKSAIKKSVYLATSETSKKALDYFTGKENHIPNLLNEIGKQEKPQFFPRNNLYKTEKILPELNSINKQDIVRKKIPKVQTDNIENNKSCEQEKLSNIKQQYPLGTASCQLYDTYILSITEENIFLTDQHAAHERLVYEHLKNTNKIEKQLLLMPEMIELNSAEVEKLISYGKKLTNLGMIIEKMGEKSIIVREIPAIIGSCDIKKLTLDILDTINEFGEALSIQEKLEYIYKTFACHTSIRAGRKLNINEMNSILRQMESNPHSGQCNHGRPTYIKLKKTDIEKLFERT
ncbi:MAG: DNA mismatch repair endonuclease MutL [Rickettsiaceae bacterium H1]|nr:DNA mismatch repair endonuclease MutL [Rickettsiaceae bacterium H1]